MKVDVETKAPCRKVLKIEVPAEQVDETLNKAVKEFKKYADIPGYRKGRAPEAMVRTRFKKQLMEHVREELVPKGYQEALKETELDVINILNATEPEPKAGEPMTFEVTVDVAPEIDLPDYKGVSVEVEKQEIDDDDVDGMIKRMREEQADIEERESGESIEEDDIVEVTFKGFFDKDPMDTEELDNPMYAGSENFWMTANESAFIPDLGDSLAGLVIGDSTEVEVEFDDEEPQESLRGKTARYEVTVHGARYKVLPELTDEFAKEAGEDSVDALKEKCRNVLEENVSGAYKDAVNNAVLTKLHEATEIELPSSEIEQETQHRIYDIVGNYSRQGVGEDEISEHKEQIYANANQAATNRLRTRYLLRAIAKAESIEATEEEIREEITRLGSQFGMDFASTYKMLHEREALDGIEEDVHQRKTMEFLVEHADIKG